MIFSTMKFIFFSFENPNVCDQEGEGPVQVTDVSDQIYRRYLPLTTNLIGSLCEKMGVTIFSIGSGSDSGYIKYFQ